MMKTASKVCSLLLLTAGLAAVFTVEGSAKASAAPAEPDPVTVATEVDVSGAFGGDLYKKCSFDSDCSHGKCKSGSCGGCGFDSDCKGWGKCKSGQCGSCSFDSDCKGFGKCSSGKCSTSPK